MKLLFGCLVTLLAVAALNAAEKNDVELSEEEFMKALQLDSVEEAQQEELTEEEIAEASEMELVDASDNDQGDIDQMISGGRNAKVFQFPAHAQIWLRANRRYKFLGNGALITQKHILTSALTILNSTDEVEYEPKDLIIVLGLTSWSGSRRGVKLVGASAVVANENYGGSQNYYQHDVALVTLKTIFRRTRFISPIKVNSYSSYPYSGQWTSVSSQGSRSGRVVTNLQQAYAKTITSYQFNRLPNHRNVRTHYTNAYFVPQNARIGFSYPGDRGAPIYDAYNRVLYGITSWGTTKSLTGAKTGAYTAWIQKTIRGN